MTPNEVHDAFRRIDRSQAWLARQTGCSRQYLAAYLAGKWQNPGKFNKELAGLDQRIIKILRRNQMNDEMDMYKLTDAVTLHVNRHAVQDQLEFTASQVYDVLMGDWPNAAEHEEWMRSASDEQIAEWVYGILINTLDDVRSP